MKKKHTAFSLVEIMVTLTILGILLAVLSPIVGKLMPSKTKTMILRSYSDLSQTIDFMLNGTDLYTPYGDEGTDDETSLKYEGFDDLKKATYKGKEYEGPKKFKDIFLDIIDASNFTNGTRRVYFADRDTQIARQGTTGYTKNGVQWNVLITNGGDRNSEIAAYIKVDVNGDKAPNCFQGSHGGCTGRTKDFDQYIVKIYQSGRIEINPTDVWVRSVINGSTSLNNE